jgi:uncharacterized membrane protein (DUF373 family)
VAREDDGHKEAVLRDKTSDFFGYIEDFFYVAVAAALSLVGIFYLGYTIYDFIKHVSDGGSSISFLVVELLSGLLLVFIFTEIIHTIRAVVEEKILVAEPFLIVGIVAAIRRILVVSAEAQDLLGKPEFGDAMLELGLLAVSIILLGLTIFLLRRTTSSEPKGEHEPD